MRFISIAAAFFLGGVISLHTSWQVTALCVALYFISQLDDHDKR